MRRLIKLIISMLLLFCLTLSASAYTVSSYEVYPEHIKVVDDGGSAYLLSYSGTSLTWQCIVPQGGGASLSLHAPAVTAGVFDGVMVVLCHDSANDQLIVCLYDIDSDALDSFSVQHVSVLADCDFYYDGELYLIDCVNRRVLNRYSSDGSLVDSFSFSDTIACMTSCDEELFVVSGNRLYRMNGGSFVPLDGARVYAPLSFVNHELLCDSRGRIYSWSDDSLRLCFTLESGGGCCSACAVGDSLYYPAGDTVIRYSAGGSKLSSLQLDDRVIALYTDGDAVYAVDGGYRVSCLRSEDFTLTSTAAETPETSESFAPAENRDPESPENDNTEKNTIVNRSGDAKPHPVSTCISSTLYRVNDESRQITGIPTGTTVTSFKQNLEYNGYSLTLFRNGKTISSGHIGTAMTAVFENDSGSILFELSVTGDLTGEGNCNTRDLYALMDYLIGAWYFDGVFYTAADLSGDGTVDAVDMVMLKRRVS